MTREEAVHWLINITADIGKAGHRELWHYEQALSEIRDMLEQPEPCEDAVSRQAAINTMYELMGHWFGADSEDEKREIKREFDKLPSVQPEPRWIPVTERLPEDEYVLISKKPSKITGSKWSVDIAIRTADPRSGKIQWRDSGFGVIQDDKVLAWMPRPKPYREEGEAE